MKPVIRVALPVLVAVPWVISQPNAQQLHQRVGQVSLSASSIQRDVSQAAYTPLVQLKGKVEIIKPLCVPAARGGALVCEEAVVLQADEADYREDTGEITPRGNVRVTFQKIKDLKIAY